MKLTDFIELVDLQEEIRGRIGYLEAWVRVEIESHRQVGGHHYLSVLQKDPGGEILSRAQARIWRKDEGIIREFQRITGRGLDAGISIVARVVVDYHPKYSLALTITGIDPGYTMGEREKQKRETIRRLEEQELIEQPTASA